jgi:hypothetical protein
MCDSIIAHFIYLCLLIKNFDIVLDVHNLVNQRSFDILFVGFFYWGILVLVSYPDFLSISISVRGSTMTCKSDELYFKCTSNNFLATDLAWAWHYGDQNPVYILLSRYIIQFIVYASSYLLPLWCWKRFFCRLNRSSRLAIHRCLNMLGKN